jgi:hypothetical protein
VLVKKTLEICRCLTIMISITIIQLGTYHDTKAVANVFLTLYSPERQERAPGRPLVLLLLRWGKRWLNHYRTTTLHTLK